MTSASYAFSTAPRAALHLAPELAPARYLLGMLLEQRGAKADAASEYRRALKVIAEGKARTYDMGGSATTLDLARAIAAKVPVAAA